MSEDGLNVVHKLHVLTEDEDPDGSRRDRQLRAIVELLRRAYERQRTPLYAKSEATTEDGSSSPPPRR